MSNLPCYGQYYDSANQSTKVQHSQNTNQPSTSDNTYAARASNPRVVRQPGQSHYGSSGYDWRTQNSTNYANTSRPSVYQNESCNESGARNGFYERQIQANNYLTQPKTSTGTGSSYSSTGLNTQGLNNLAYAARLDSADVAGTGHHVQRSSVTSGSTHSAQLIANTSQRLRSPVNQQTNQYGAGHSVNYPYASELPSVSPGHDQLSTAAALAGTVSHRYHQSSGSTGQSSSSPSINNPRSALSAPQRTKSPPHAASLPEKARQSPALPQANLASSNTANQRPTQNRPQSWKSGQNRIQQPANTSEKQLSHPVNSISNLVTHTDTDDSFHIQYTTSLDGQSDMLGYVDPAQVFNPFYREHEQRRKEIARAEAEAEARKHAEAQAQAEAGKRAAEDEAAASLARDSEKQAAKKLAAKHKPQIQGKATESDQPQTTTHAGDAQVSNDDDMANELKLMMVRMKEIQSKDPSMFQKLLDSMRGSRSGTATGQVSSPQTTQQSMIPPQQKATPATQNSTSQGAISEADSTPKTQESDLARANGYMVVVESNPEGLPDLGQFPARRRIPPSRKKETDSATPSKQPANTEKAVPDHSVPTPVSAGPPAKIDTPVSTSIPDPAPTPGPASGPMNSDKPPQPAPLSQGLPPRTLNGGTIWPEDKRAALAEAAVRSLKDFALKGFPGNADIEITTADIDAILKSNPSYIDLCETLEKKGFRFHRGQFARQLLAKVPFLNTPTAAKIQPPVHPAMPTYISPTTAGGPSSPPNLPTSPAIPVQAVHLSHEKPIHPIPPGPGSIHLPPPPPPSQFRAVNGESMLVKPETRIPVMQQYNTPQRLSKGRAFVPSRNEPQVGSKEAMARKRDFSELIDLTVLSDNEDYVLSKKHARTDNPPTELDLFQQYEIQMSSAPTSQRAFASGPMQPGQPLRFDPAVGRLPQISLMDNALNGSKIDLSATKSRRLAKAINRAEGLLKIYYDPKTVARDILIAAGRHPTERPLNAHMAGLLGRHIDIDSDLATFDWDAIDPGGPPMPVVEYANVVGPPQHQLGDVRKEVAGCVPNSDKRDDRAYSPNHVLPAPAPLTSLPSQSRLKHPDKAADSRVNRLSGLRNSQVPGPDVAPKTSSTSRPLSQPKSSPKKLSSQPQLINKPKMMTSDAPVTKRRGRPPGSKSKTMSVAAMQRAARQVTSVTLPSLSGPHLPIFRCRWKGCKSHLHNSETLHQHISKVHGQLEENIDEYACWWKKCRFLEEDSDGMWLPVQTFPSKENWLKHIEQDHIYPITLKQGDGPSTKHIGKPTKSSLDVSRFRFHPQLASNTRTFSYLDPQTILMDRTRYLSDKDGRTTTPMVSDRSNKYLERDTMTLIAASHEDADQAAQRSFIRTHRDDKRSPKAIAEETLRALTANKAKFGPGMKDEGCVLARESVKSRLVQNPGIVRVTEAAD
ncbi:uncharacterized protein A1O9_09999 [Exophiala aquamarina CBS 119918]|uniref:C2H2-type domain-containing protein n=1 Tax=Exophiala aquamarina CBS 119918 TaxID=1182545 RepID=A0A072P4L3_9EURO|nr:uncharacterized protein A1O9_09999 [Exophiala aquamarina CBS 119918]KEF54203.1 hypothetical protein A1O9_09999 [Exophiala aquamarina CBS 119918]